MAKATSWLTVVKRAFRSPSKDITEGKKQENNHHEDHKKREKRRWLFRKPVVHVQQTNEQKTPIKVNNNINNNGRIEINDIINSPAPARVASAQAAVENVRLHCIFKEYFYAAIVIQTAFRGYLARRALRALRGVVKLQALVRGQNVRKQAKLTLKCMKALVRVQHQVSQQRAARLSVESTRKSMTSSLRAHRLSISREMSCGGDVVHEYWNNDNPQMSDESEEKLQLRKEAALRRERAHAYAFSTQIRRGRRSPSAGNEDEIEKRTKWLDRWMATKQWESDYTDAITSSERRDHNIIRSAHVVDPSGPHSARRSYHAQLTGLDFGLNTPPSPAQQNQVTPSPSKAKAVKLRSASPRCYSAAHTPSLARYGLGSSVPNYMAATESAKARTRPNSTAKQRPSMPERDQLGRGLSGSARKRLSYNEIAEPQNGDIGVGFGYGNFGQCFSSPSFKSLQNGHAYGMETLSSCYDEGTFVRDFHLAQLLT